MVVPMSVGNSQYFVESLTQAALSYAMQITGVERAVIFVVYTGGDGRLLNSYAMEVLIRVAAGNGQSTVRVADTGIMTTGEATATLDARKSTNKGPLLPLSGQGDRMGGLRGSIGLQLVLHERGKEQAASVSRRKGWADVGSLMGRSQRVNMVASRPSGYYDIFQPGCGAS